MVDESEVLRFNPDTQSVTRVPPEQALGEEVGRVTTILEVRRHKKLLLFVVTGELSPGELYRRLAAPFDRLGFDLHVAMQPGARVLVARPHGGERLWVNWVLLGATVFTTTLAGAALSGVDPVREPRLLWQGLPFSLALLFVLGIHELGHYAVARGWGMKTTLPFFIPLPPQIFPLGTFGAFIRHRGPIPSRRALFDVGVSGPLIGLAAAVIVSAIGLSLPYEAPRALQEALRRGEKLPGLGLPPLFEWLVVATGFQGTGIHPVAFAGWVGMLVTVFNLLPAGQLDGGHVVRAVLGRRAEAVSRAVPLVLMGVGVLSSALGRPGGMWMMWGLFVFLFTLGGHPSPLDDVERLDRRRLAVAVGTLVLAVLCVTPVPFTVE